MNLGQVIDADASERLRREARERPTLALSDLLERGLAIVREHQCLSAPIRESTLFTGDTKRIIDAFRASKVPLTVTDVIQQLGLTHPRVMPHVYRLRKRGTLKVVDEEERPMRYRLTAKVRR